MFPAPILFFVFGIITPPALAAVCHLAAWELWLTPDCELHHPASSPSAHMDVSAHENACVSCRSALKLVSISSPVIINFPLMRPRSQRRGDVNGCPSARRSAQSPAGESNKCARACVECTHCRVRWCGCCLRGQTSWSPPPPWSASPAHRQRAVLAGRS